MANLIPLCGGCGHEMRLHIRAGKCNTPVFMAKQNRETGQPELDSEGHMIPEPGICPCPQATRTDVKFCMQAAAIAESFDRANAVLFTILRVICEIGGVEVNEKGEITRIPKIHGI